MMPPSIRSGSAYGDAGGANEGNPAFDHQFVGLFRGLGVSSKEPVCSKRNTDTKQFHNATHFAIGCKKWDNDQVRGMSTAHATFVDPEVVYGTVDCPDKNSSVVELRQREFVPAVHFRTEQREQYPNPGPQPRDQPLKRVPQVHLGDDVPELCAQSHAVHGRVSPDAAERATRLRAAGSGVLVPTSLWAKGTRCNPVTGGARSSELHDYQMAAGMNFGKSSHNKSTIVMEANVRNPIHGYHVPLQEYAAPVRPGRPHASTDHVAMANASVPPLRSLGALRPHH